MTPTPWDQIEQDVFDTETPTTRAAVRQRIIQKAHDLKLDPALALALAHQESRFNAHATSPTGVEGLYQVTNATGARYGQTPESRRDPDVSMHAGLSYLKDLLTETGGNVRQALARYGDPKETDFPDKVLRWYPLHMATLAKRPQSRTLMAKVEQTLFPSAEAATPETPAPAGLDLDAIERQVFGDLTSAPAAAPDDPASAEIARLEAEVGRASTPEEALARVQEYRDIFTPYGELQPPMPDMPRAEIPIEKRAPVAAPEAAPEATPGKRRMVYDLPGHPGPAYLTPEEEAILRPALTAAVQQAPKELAALGIDTLGTAGGAALGTLGGPAAPVTVPAGAVAGSVAANELNKSLGLREPSLLGDVLAVAGPLAPVVPAAVKATARHLPGVARARRALQTSVDATAAQKGAYDDAYIAQTNRLRERADVATQEAVDAMPAPGVSPEMAQRRSVYQNQEAIRRATHVQQEEQRLLDHATKLQQAEEEAIKATETARQSAANQQTKEYDRAARLKAKYLKEREAYDTAVTAQATAVAQARSIPERYLPTMPDDIPPSPGARTVTQAAAPDPYKTPEGRWKVPLKDVPSHELELQDFLRQPDKQGRWGVNLTDEELFGEFDALLGKAESGSKRLKNSKSGLTTQDLANRAHEQGFIDAPDTDSLLRALDDSVRGGRPVYSTQRTIPEPPATSEITPPTLGPDAPVSKRLYARLNEVAGDAPVDMSFAGERLARLLDEVAPITELQPSAAQLKTLLETIQKLDVTNVKYVNALLEDLTPLTRATNGKVRHAALEAADMLHEVVVETGKQLPETAAAGKLMGQARFAYRREKAVGTLKNAFATGHGIIEQMPIEGVVREVINVRTALKRFNVLLNGRTREGRYFAGSFTKQEINAMRQDIEALASTPTIPSRVPSLSESAVAREIPVPPSVEPKPVPPFEPQTYAPRLPNEATVQPSLPVAERPTYPDYRPPAPVQPTLRPPSGARLMADLTTTGFSLLASGRDLGLAAGAGLGVATGDVLAHLLAQFLLNQEGRKILMRLMTPSGYVSPRDLTRIATTLRLPATGYMVQDDQVEP